MRFFIFLISAIVSFALSSSSQADPLAGNEHILLRDVPLAAGTAAEWTGGTRGRFLISVSARPANGALGQTRAFFWVNATIGLGLPKHEGGSPVPMARVEGSIAMQSEIENLGFTQGRFVAFDAIRDLDLDTEVSASVRLLGVQLGDGSPFVRADDENADPKLRGFMALGMEILGLRFSQMTHGVNFAGLEPLKASLEGGFTLRVGDTGRLKVTVFGGKASWAEGMTEVPDALLLGDARVSGFSSTSQTYADAYSRIDYLVSRHLTLFLQGGFRIMNLIDLEPADGPVHATDTRKVGYIQSGVLWLF